MGDPSIVNIGESPRLERARLRLSQSQFGLIIDFMTLNPELIDSNQSTTEKRSKYAINKKWEELTAILNSDVTGPQKGLDKWKKTWADLKFNIRKRARKFKSSLSSSGDEYIRGLTDFEQRVWNLIKPEAKELRRNPEYINTSNKATDGSQNYPQELENYSIILGLHSSPSVVNVTGVQTDNAETRMEYEHDDILDQSKSLNSVGETSEGSSDALENLGEASTVSSNCENEVPVKKQIQGDKPDSIALNPPNYTSAKKLQLQRMKKRKTETGILKLLQKQNELLENIAQSITRIEKSLQANPPQPKNDVLSKVAENIDKITDSFSSVSTSLKKIAEK